MARSAAHAATPSGHHYGRWLPFTVALLAMLAPFSIDTYLPSFPDIGREFAASSVALQQTLSLYLLAFAVMMLVYGPVSDAFGRKTVVLASTAVYVASSIGCALAPGMQWLLMLRIGQGLSASGCRPAVRWSRGVPSSAMPSPDPRRNA
ncbi:MAG: MFS transporter [Sulfuricaulis sp.]